MLQLAICFQLCNREVVTVSWEVYLAVFGLGCMTGMVVAYGITLIAGRED
ncbi:hypothetical protein [Bacillus phage Anath]|uniref:Uncharacterized protein n=1 Tax=Bacillus phage Anath TaxID=2108114 RepID=A0A2P1JUS9_9CAUD|nr:hypothetical protein [Bacillus phage Anath]